MNYNEWLESLKVGDEVCLSGRLELRIYTIVKITDKQIITENNRFWKKNGVIVGGGTWNSYSIKPVTVEIKDKVYDIKLDCTIKHRLRLLADTHFPNLNVRREQKEELLRVITDFLKTRDINES